MSASYNKDFIRSPGKAVREQAVTIAPSAARENFVKGVEQALLAHATRSRLASSGSQPLRRGTVRPVNVRAALQASFGAAAAPCVQVIACPARRASSKLNEVRIQLHARSARRARRVSFAAVALVKKNIMNLCIASLISLSPMIPIWSHPIGDHGYPHSVHIPNRCS